MAGLTFPLTFSSPFSFCLIRFPVAYFFPRDLRRQIPGIYSCVRKAVPGTVGEKGCQPCSARRSHSERDGAGSECLAAVCVRACACAAQGGVERKCTRSPRCLCSGVTGPWTRSTVCPLHPTVLPPLLSPTFPSSFPLGVSGVTCCVRASESFHLMRPKYVLFVLRKIPIWLLSTEHGFPYSHHVGKRGHVITPEEGQLAVRMARNLVLPFLLAGQIVTGWFSKGKRGALMSEGTLSVSLREVHLCVPPLPC